MTQFQIKMETRTQKINIKAKQKRIGMKNFQYFFILSNLLCVFIALFIINEHYQTYYA